MSSSDPTVDMAAAIDTGIWPRALLEFPQFLGPQPAQQTPLAEQTTFNHDVVTAFGLTVAMAETEGAPALLPPQGGQVERRATLRRQTTDREERQALFFEPGEFTVPVMQGAQRLSPMPVDYHVFDAACKVNVAQRRLREENRQIERSDRRNAAVNGPVQPADFGLRPENVDEDDDVGVYRAFVVTISTIEKTVAVHEVHDGYTGRTDANRAPITVNNRHHLVSNYDQDWVSWLFEDTEQELVRMRREGLPNIPAQTSTHFRNWVALVTDRNAAYTRLQWLGLIGWGYLLSVWLSMSGWTRRVTYRVVTPIWPQDRFFVLCFDSEAHWRGDAVRRRGNLGYFRDAYHRFLTFMEGNVVPEHNDAPNGHGGHDGNYVNGWMEDDDLE